MENKDEKTAEERGKKSMVEIIKMYSPRPTSGYDNSWIRLAMQAYADQENAALKDRVKFLEELRDSFKIELSKEQSENQKLRKAVDYVKWWIKVNNEGDNVNFDFKEIDV